MNPAPRFRLDVRRLFESARRSFVGALGWVLMAAGAAAIVTPVPFAIPVLLAGAALVEDTNPQIAGAVLGIVATARRKLTQLGSVVRNLAREISPAARLVPATSH